MDLFDVESTPEPEGEGPKLDAKKVVELLATPPKKRRAIIESSDGELLEELNAVNQVVQNSPTLKAVMEGVLGKFLLIFEKFDNFSDKKPVDKKKTTRKNLKPAGMAAKLAQKKKEVNAPKPTRKRKANTSTAVEENKPKKVEKKEEKKVSLKFIHLKFQFLNHI